MTRAAIIGSNSRDLAIAVVICTHNPRPDLLHVVLESLHRQSLPAERFEIVVVDNNSAPALESEDVAPALRRPFRIVREERQGLVRARIRGIASTAAPLIVFVDDDNELDRDYLRSAVDVARHQPRVGVFAGITRGCFEAPIGAFKRRFVSHLGVRAGQQRVTGDRYDAWWAPIGAGMVVRREVARCYVRRVEQEPGFLSLGRSGAGLLGADDTLMNRVAIEAGYLCSFEPKLRLNHHITAGRTSLAYLLRLIKGHGVSAAVLNQLLGTASADDRLAREPWLLLKRLLHRLLEEGMAGSLSGLVWDIGYRQGLRAHGAESVRNRR